MMPVGTDYNIGSDSALWPPQGPMQGMPGGSGAPYPKNPGTPYNQGSLDVGGYPGNQPQRTPISMRIYRNFCIPEIGKISSLNKFRMDQCFTKLKLMEVF